MISLKKGMGSVVSPNELQIVTSTHRNEMNGKYGLAK